MASRIAASTDSDFPKNDADLSGPEPPARRNAAEPSKTGRGFGVSARWSRPDPMIRPFRALLRLIALPLIAAAATAAPQIFEPAAAPGPADNPLKGFVPYAGQAREFPHSLEFGYLPLAEVMKGPDRFDWSALDRLLDDIASRDCQSVFRFYIEYPRKPSGLPAYLIEEGVKLREWTNTNTQPLPPAIDHTPDYEDPRLRAALTSFIAALGKRYDGDPRVGFITAGLLGTWGEWHCYPHREWFASKTVQKEVMDAYEAAFRKTPVLLRYPAGDDDHAHASNSNRGFGYHDDSFAWATLDTGKKDEDWFYLTALTKAGPAAQERWRTSPIGGEIRPELWPCLWKAGGCTKGQDFARCVRETHASWLMDSSTSGPLAPDEKERAIAAARSLGYEFRVIQAAAELKERTLEVAVTLGNFGVAPFYAAWPVEIRLIGPDQKTSGAKLPLDLKNLLPEDRLSATATLDLAPLPPGDYRLLIGVPNPMKSGRPLRFANADPEPAEPGWLTLGNIAVPAP